MRITAVVLLCIAACSVYASDLTVFGFKLGERLPLPKCTVTAMYVPPPTTCLAIAYQGWQVKFSADDHPAFIAGSGFFPLQVDGKMIGIEFATPGVRTQREVLLKLSTKYGEATRMETRVAENQVALLAIWDLPDLKITFDSAHLNLVDQGLVIIDLPQAAQIRRQNAARPVKPPIQGGKSL